MEAEIREFRMSRKIIVYFAILVALLAGIGKASLAQATASLSGTVTGGSGATVPNTRVVVTNQGTGVTASTQTDASGAYLFPSLPIGVYRIEVSASSFQTAVIGNVKLEVATAVTQSVQLKVGESTQRVEIVADAAVIEATTNSMGQVINDKTVQEIPLNGRHFTDLSLLTAGTVTPPANGFLSAPLRGQGSFGRSEERRVGKEGRSRWSPYH